MHTKKIKTLQVVSRGEGGADRNTLYGEENFADWNLWKFSREFHFAV